MSEATHNFPNNNPVITEQVAREKLEETFADIAAYDPENHRGIPYVRKEVNEFVHGQEPVPFDVLMGYTSQLKFNEDRRAEYGKKEPNYWQKIEEINQMTPENVRSLYEAEGATGSLHAMLAHQTTHRELNMSFVGSALDTLKSIYGVGTVAELVNGHESDPIVQKIGAALRGGNIQGDEFRIADIGRGELKGTQEFRQWLRNALMLATHISEPEQADAYTYSMSRTTWGTTLGALDTLIRRVETYGADKLESIRDFAHISALASFSDAQLDRMYKLASNDQAEIERLKGHDVIVTFINLDGDHNGVSSDVAKRLDDDAERNIFFEITNPRQIYTDLKKLHEMGINPATLIFATHGSEGQLAISERPALDSNELIDHVTTITA